MSDEYVIRTVSPGHWPPTITKIFVSAEAAADAIDRHRKEWGYQVDGWTYTVHKLGPAIEPPQPREWVVVNRLGDLWKNPTTLREAEEALKDAGERGGIGPYRIMRIVPNDGAA